MKETPDGQRLVAGYNQFAKLVRHGKAVKVYLACDADPFFASAVRRELGSRPDIELDSERDSAFLAEMAGVEVPTAVLTVAE